VIQGDTRIVYTVLMDDDEVTLVDIFNKEEAKKYDSFVSVED